jgi:hypothetical protein
MYINSRHEKKNNRTITFVNWCITCSLFSISLSWIWHVWFCKHPQSIADSSVSLPLVGAGNFPGTVSRASSPCIARARNFIPFQTPVMLFNTSMDNPLSNSVKVSEEVDHQLVKVLPTNSPPEEIGLLASLLNALKSAQT